MQACPGDGGGGGAGPVAAEGHTRLAQGQQTKQEQVCVHTTTTNKLQGRIGLSVVKLAWEHGN